MATGIGSGIGAIFGAPLGGAVLATEILYRDDFDVEALLPCFVASTVAYVIFGAAIGFTPLFGFVSGYRFSDPTNLLWFALIGVLGGLIGLLYAKSFYGIADAFGRLALPRWLKPAAGGLLVGTMALAIPEVLGTGYGWIQQGLTRQLLSLPLWIVLILPFARIVATGLSIGSGGSGGIFGPGMIIGAFIGASVWRLFEPVVPSMGHSPAPYVIVGMMCCFGSISRAPLAVMLMVAEMTGNLSILAPAMLAVGLAWFIVRRSDDTIYRSQLRLRSDAPAQRLMVGMPLLASIPVAQAMEPPRVVLTPDMERRAALRHLVGAGVPGAPVVDRWGHFEGAVTREVLERTGSNEPLQPLVDPFVPTVLDSARLDVALDSLTTAANRWIPVLDEDRRVRGTIATSDIVRGYRLGLLATLREARSPGGDADAGTTELAVHPGSRLQGVSLREADLPVGVLVTTIQRHKDLIVPRGDTVLQSGDRLTVVGRAEDLHAFDGPRPMSS